MQADSTPSLTVVMAPDWRQHNPYLDLLAGALRENGVAVVFVKEFSRVLPLFRSLKKEPASCVLHLHWYEAYVMRVSVPGQIIDGLALLLDLNLLKRRGHALVWTLHNELPHNATWPAWHRFLRRRIAILADQVITHNPLAFTLLDARAASLAQKNVIPHPHYRDYYGPALQKPQARTSLSIQPNERLFLFLGLIQPYKGLEDLLAAWRSLGPETAGARLLVVGEPESAAYEAQIRDCAASLPNVELRLKFAQDAELPLYFSAADCAVFPFRRILTSGSLMLARSYGVRAIVPDTKAVRAQLEDTPAFFFEQGSIQSLSTSLRTALRDPSLASGTTPSPTLWSWEQAASATIPIYHSAVDRSSGGSTN